MTEPWNSLWRRCTRTFQDLRWENTGTLGSLRPPPILRPPVPRDPVAKPKVKAYMRVGGAKQGFRTPADAARQLLPPPLPPQVIGGAAGVRVAPVPILPARGGNALARGAVVRTPSPSTARGGYAPACGSGGAGSVSCTASGGKASACGSGGACSVSCIRQWAPRARKRIWWNCNRVSASVRVGSSCTSRSSPEACS